MAEVALLPLDVPLPRKGYRELLREKGVVVYRRQGSSPIDLAAEGLFPAPPRKVQAALLDYGRHIKMIDNIASSLVLVKRPDHLLVYQRLDLPLISDRDYTLLVTWGIRQKTAWLRFRCANNRGPAPKEGVVRVSHHQGGWLLRPQGLGQTWARYQLSLDLGGSLPRWLARSGSGDQVPALFSAIARRVRR